jgi:hypothetical protein
MMSEAGDIVFYNDGNQFVPSILVRVTGDKDEIYVIHGGSPQEAARRAPSDYGDEGGGVTYCLPSELPPDAPVGGAGGATGA